MSHILISGGSRGIGAATAKLFAGKGHNVTYFFKNAPVLQGERITPVQCDVTDPLSVADSVGKACDNYGRVEVLISNAGISYTGLATDFDFKDYRMIMDTNFGGLFNLTSEIIPSMVHNGSGVILAVSSMWGQTGASCETLYSATKGAVDSYVKSLAKELGPSGIRVNAVSPGVIDTDMMSEYTDSDKTALADDTPLGRLGTPDDIAQTLYFLSGSRASFITGQIIGVNGGFLA